MFLNVPVILFTGGVCLRACWDTTTPTPLGSRPPGSIHPRSRHPWEQTPPPRADPPPGSRPPLGVVHTWRYGQQAGTHSTRMHSCCFNCSATIQNQTSIVADHCRFLCHSILVEQNLQQSFQDKKCHAESLDTKCSSTSDKHVCAKK